MTTQPRPRSRFLPAIAATAAALALAPTSLAPTSLAPMAMAAPVTPGAPMRVAPLEATVPGLPAELDSYSCSQGVAGTVTLVTGAEQPVMVTAGHCLISTDPAYPLNTVVYSPQQGGDQRIGQLHREGAPILDETLGFVDGGIEAFTIHDWSTVAVDEGVPASRAVSTIDFYGRSTGSPVELTGVRDYPDLAGTQVSTDNFGQPICKDGINSGRSCGTQLFRTQHGLYSWGLNYANGDSGGVNWDPNNGEALGVSSQGIGPLGRAQPIDSALQEAYDIPDGQVNERFRLAESTEPIDEGVRSLAADEDAIVSWAEEEYGVVDFVAEHEANVAAAQADATHYTQEVSQQLGAGDVPAAAETARQAGDAAAHHAEVLPVSASNAAFQEAVELGVEWGLLN